MRLRSIAEIKLLSVCVCVCACRCGRGPALGKGMAPLPPPAHEDVASSSVRDSGCTRASSMESAKLLCAVDTSLFINIRPGAGWHVGCSAAMFSGSKGFRCRSVDPVLCY